MAAFGRRVRVRGWSEWERLSRRRRCAGGCVVGGVLTTIGRMLGHLWCVRWGSREGEGGLTWTRLFLLLRGIVVCDSEKA